MRSAGTTGEDELSQVSEAGNMNADLQSAQTVLEGERIEGNAVTVEDRGRIVDRTVNEECHVAPVLIHTTDKHAENQAFEDYVQSTLDTVAKNQRQAINKKRMTK